MLHDLLCVLNATEVRSDTSLDHRIDQEPLVAPAVIPAVGRLTTKAEHSLERSTIEQQPTFDMRIGNRFDDGLRNIFNKGVQLPRSP